MIRTRPTALIIKENKILFARHEKKGKSYYLLPGGGLEKNETIENCLKRELKEECLIDAAVKDFLCCVFAEGKKNIFFLIFLCIINKETKGKIKDKRVKESVFLNAAEIQKKIIYPDIKKDLLSFLKTKKFKYMFKEKKWKR